MSERMIWCGIRRPLKDENLVIYKFEGDEFWANLPLYLDEVNHSQTGFEWGYNGSGPSQLAYAILRTYFLHKGYNILSGKTFAQRYYMKFKRDFVSVWKGDEWEITSDQIDFWVGGEKAGWI